MSRRSLAGEGSPGNDLAYWLRDGIAGAVAGGAGLLVMLSVLAVAAQRGVFTFDTFGSFASLVYLDLFFPPVLAGLAVFALIGTTAWPLLFTSLEPYLPGRTIQTRGMVFSGTLWLGYVVGAYPGYGGLRLAGFLAFTLVAHLAYGFSLGNVLDFFLSEYHRSVAAEARGDDESTGPTDEEGATVMDEPTDDEGGDSTGSEDDVPAPPGVAPDAPGATPATDGAGATTEPGDADAGPSGPSDPSGPPSPTASSSTTGEADAEPSAEADDSTPGDVGTTDDETTTDARVADAVDADAVDADATVDAADRPTGDGTESGPIRESAGDAPGDGSAGESSSEGVEALPPLLQFERALYRLRQAVPGEPEEIRALERAYERLQRTSPEGRPSVVSDIGDHLTGLRDRVPADGDAERWLDSMENRVRQYLATRRNTSEALSLSGVQLLVDGETRSVEDLRTETATIRATVTNRGEESGADVQVDFRGEDGVLLRSTTLSAGRVPAGGRTTLETSVYVPSIATSYEVRAVDPREGQRFLPNV